MNRRIAKKVVEGKKHNHSHNKKVKACKRLGLPAPAKPTPKAPEFSYNITGVDTGRGSSKTGFHYRTGMAPSHLPEALPAVNDAALKGV